MDSGSLIEQLRARDSVIHICGHRGSRGLMPENSLEGFELTFSSGIKTVELDVLATADMVSVITHDPKLNPAITRDADGKWLEDDSQLVYQMTFEQLQAYDVGGIRPGTKYAARFPEQRAMSPVRIPSLASLCDLVLSPKFEDCKLIVEIKSDPAHPEYTPGLPEYVDCVLRPVLERDLQDRVVLHSFDWRVLRECERQAPAMLRSFLSCEPTIGMNAAVNVYGGSPWMDGLKLESFAGSLPRLVAASGGSLWAPWHMDLSAQDIAIARELGLVVYVWTLNTAEEMGRAIDLGVDGIVTDYPERAKSLLQERGLSWQAQGA